LIALVAPAMAATVNATLCGEYHVKFEDVNDMAEGHIADEFFEDNLDEPARGAEVRISETGSSSYTPYNLSNSNPACVVVALNDNKTYTVKLVSRAVVDGHTIEVRTSDGVAPEPSGGTANALYVFSIPNWVPVTSTTWLRPTTVGGVWNLAAVLGWALHREDLGMSNGTLTVYREPCAGGTPRVYQDNSCASNATRTIWYRPGAEGVKIGPIHELGHIVVAEGCNGGVAADVDRGGTGGNCVEDNYGVAKEKTFTSNAVNEGIAWFYPAFIFNNPAQGSCAIKKGDNFDLEQDGEEPGYETTPTCGGSSAEEFPDEDYLGNMCTGPLAERSTRIDWWRTWWDLVAEEGWTVADVCNVWDGANPNTWDQDGGSGANDPWDRLYSSAVSRGLGADFSSVSITNGVHR
jgi:hypothetical protein